MTKKITMFNRLVILPLAPFKWWLGLVAILATSVWMVAVSMLPLSAGLGESVKFAGYFILCILCVLLCMRPLARWHFGLHGIAPNEVGGVAQPKWLRPTAVVAVSVFILWVVSEVFSSSSREADESIQQVFKSLGFGESVANDIWIALAVTVFAPLGEEMLFRVLIMRSLSDGLRNLRHKHLRWLSNTAVSLIIAVVISSVLFADSHGSDEQSVQLYAITIMGVVFALSYVISGSLFAPVMAHSINNALALFLIISPMPTGSVSMAAQISICLGPFLAFFILLTLRQVIRR